MSNRIQYFYRSVAVGCLRVVVAVNIGNCIFCCLQDGGNKFIWNCNQFLLQNTAPSSVTQ